MSERLFGIHGAALELRSQRMGVLTSNIANAATPGYRARDIDFAAALDARMGGASRNDAISAATRSIVVSRRSADSRCRMALSTTLISLTTCTGNRMVRD